MHLANLDIIRALKRWGTIQLSPMPSLELRNGRGHRPLSTDSLDLSLGGLMRPKSEALPPIDHMNNSIHDWVDANFEPVEFKEDEHGSYVVMPANTFWLAHTAEYMVLPTAWELHEQLLCDWELLTFLERWPAVAWISKFIESVLWLCGRRCLTCHVHGKTRFARTCFEVHICAPILHNGHDGTVVLELRTGPVPQILRPGMPICQLQFFELRSNPPWNSGNHIGQKCPNGRR